METDLDKLIKLYNAGVSKEDFDRFHQLQKFEKKADPLYIKELLGLKRKPSKLLFSKVLEEKDKIYPGYFANLIVNKGQGAVIAPMRYRIRPQNSDQEVPSKYNMYNARRDTLTSKATWKRLYQKNQAILPVCGFWEWVKKELKFFKFAADRPLSVPCLYDTFQNKNKEIFFYSFAIITDDSPQEIKREGILRAPLILRDERKVTSWLANRSLN